MECADTSTTVVLVAVGTCDEYYAVHLSSISAYRHGCRSGRGESGKSYESKEEEMDIAKENVCE